MECRSLGEERGNYTNSNVRQIRQKETTHHRHESSGSSSKGGGKLAVGLLAGAGVGVLAGMLLAPERGKDLRRQVGKKVTEGFNGTKEKVNSWTGRKRGYTEAHVNEAPDLSRSYTGNVHKSPYTDENKWEDEEIRDMKDDSRNIPPVI